MIGTVKSATKISKAAIELWLRGLPFTLLFENHPLRIVVIFRNLGEI